MRTLPPPPSPNTPAQEVDVSVNYRTLTAVLFTLPYSYSSHPCITAAGVANPGGNAFSTPSRRPRVSARNTAPCTAVATIACSSLLPAACAAFSSNSYLHYHKPNCSFLPSTNITVQYHSRVQFAEPPRSVCVLWFLEVLQGTAHLPFNGRGFLRRAVYKDVHEGSVRCAVLLFVPEDAHPILHRAVAKPARARTT